MKSKLKKRTNYKAKCLIMSPHGIINEGTVLNGSQWEFALVYEVGNDFNEIFEVTTEPSQWDELIKK